MKRACLTFLAIFEEMRLLTPPPDWHRTAGSAGVALPSALFASMGVGYLQGVSQKIREKSLLARSGHPGTLEDRKKTAVAGVIQSLGSPLTSPVSGTECVAYDYEICHYRKSDSAQKGGLVPSSGSGDFFPVRLMMGDAAAVSKTLTTRIIGNIFGSVLFLAVAVAVIEGFFYFLPEFV